MLGSTSNPEPLEAIVPLKKIEYGFGYIIIRSPYTPYSIYLRRTINLTPEPQGMKPKSPLQGAQSDGVDDKVIDACNGPGFRTNVGAV